MNGINPEAVRPYVGRAGVFPTYVAGELAKIPAGAAMFPNLKGEKRTRATGRLVAELRGRATTAEEAARWWRGGRVLGIGLNCGELQCLDFDDPSAHGEWREALRAEGAEALLERTARAETMSGGLHVWAYVPGCRERSRQLARHAKPQFDPTRGKTVLVRIETRGHGGYALVPPSPGYRWLDGRGVLDLPPLNEEEYARLVRAAERLDRGRKVEGGGGKEKRERPSGGPETPNDWFERTASWDELIAQAGGRFYREVSGQRQYTRPGKARGVSLTTGNGFAGQDFAKVHTPNWPPFEDGELMSKYGCYAILHHGRDWAAATRSIARMEGYATSPLPLGRGEVARIDAALEEAREHLCASLEFSEGGGHPTPTPTQGEGRDRPLPDLNEADPEIRDPRSAVARSGDFLKNDLGNARRLVERYGHGLRYCSDWARFLLWDGVRWKADTKDAAGARQLAHATADAMAADEAKEMRAWGAKSGGSTALTAMLRETQALLPVASGALDTHDFLLGVRNGVLDLSTGRLVENPRSLLITKQAPVAWDPDARCPRFEAFLREIMRDRRDLVALLLRVMGYCLTGSTREQKFFLLYGARGRNGKSTLLELIQALLGPELCGPINKKLLTDSGRDSARFAMASLEGRRAAFSNESGRGAAYDTEFIKEFAGGTTVQAEKKGQDEYSFKLRAKLLHSVNAMPSADWSASYGDRAVPIPFEQSWYAKDNPNWQEGDMEPDPDLLDRLREELPGILALVVRHGTIPWIAEGLRIPAPVARLLESYRAENDSLGAWLAERCERGANHRAGMQEAFDSYRGFLKASGVPFRGRMTTFQREMLALPGIGHVKPQNRSTLVGIRLRPEHELYADELGGEA